jgi:hypothetical protein
MRASSPSTVAGVEGAHAWADLAEAGCVRGDREVAADVKDVAAAHGDPVHGGDDRLGDVPDHAVERLDLEPARERGPVVTRLRTLLGVATRAEGPVTGTGQGDDPDAPVGPGALEAPDHLVDGAAAESVVAVGTVDRDPRQPTRHLVGDVGQFFQLH